MKSIVLFVFAISVIPGIGFAEEIVCQVKYTGMSGESVKGNEASDAEQPMTGWDDFVVYKKCKEFCFNISKNTKPNPSNVAACFINGESLEQSDYKTIYLNKKANICHISSYKGEKKVGGSYFDLAADENACKQLIPTKHWCQQHECNYTFGKW